MSFVKLKELAKKLMVCEMSVVEGMERPSMTEREILEHQYVHQEYEQVKNELEKAVPDPKKRELLLWLVRLEDKVWKLLYQNSDQNRKETCVCECTCTKTSNTDTDEVHPNIKEDIEEIDEMYLNIMELLSDLGVDVEELDTRIVNMVEEVDNFDDVLKRVLANLHQYIAENVFSKGA